MKFVDVQKAQEMIRTQEVGWEDVITDIQDDT